MNTQLWPWRGRFALSCIVLLATVALFASRAHGHGEEIAVGGGARGSVQLTAGQMRAIGLTLAVAKERPMATLLTLNGVVQSSVDRQAVVSSRISGAVTALYARLGDVVSKGQRLARVQSRLVGDPPPSVALTAPRAGVIDAVEVTLGQAVEPAVALFHISDPAQVNVVARVYEEDLAKVRLGQVAHIRALSYPDRIFTGKVTLVGPVLDASSRTVPVWISLSNPGGVLKPNLFARVDIALTQNGAALAVPTATIIAANGEQFVFVRSGSKFNRVEISTGAVDDAHTEVSDGLVPGDEVVIQGNRQLYTLWLTGGKPPAAEED